MKLIDKNKLLEELKKLKQNLSASPIVVIEDVESLVENLEVKEVDLDKNDKTKLMRKCVKTAYKRGYDMGVLQTTNKMNSNTKEVDLEKDVDTILPKVKGFLVRDKDDYTAIYAEKPHRGKTEWVDGNDSCLMTINDARLVPDIEFEDEPVEVEVTLKRLNAEE